MEQKEVEIISLGGNAMLGKEDNSVPAQREAAKVACEFIAELIDRGCRVLVAHGNGPQVGFMKKRVDLAVLQNALHGVPLDVLDANSQGALGYLLEQGISTALVQKGWSPKYADCIRSLVCRVIVKGLGEKTKPIGEWMTREQADQLMAKNPNLTIKERPDAPKDKPPWREHVYSPRVKEVLGMKDVKTLLDSGTTVVYGGGGGIPMVEHEDGTLEGVEGVIDKDDATAAIGKQLAALQTNVRRISIFTAVAGVIDPDKFPNGPVIPELTISEAREMVPRLPKGSMGPKLDACVRFVEAVEGSRALIAALDDCRRAFIKGTAGTRIIRGQAWM